MVVEVRTQLCGRRWWPQIGNIELLLLCLCGFEPLRRFQIGQVVPKYEAYDLPRVFYARRVLAETQLLSYEDAIPKLCLNRELVVSGIAMNIFVTISSGARQMPSCTNGYRATLFPRTRQTSTGVK